MVERECVLKSVVEVDLKFETNVELSASGLFVPEDAAKLALIYFGSSFESGVRENFRRDAALCKLRFPKVEFSQNGNFVCVALID